jgi:chromosome segregation ATPase
MPVDYSTRVTVIEQLLNGQTYDEVATSVGIAKGTVSRIADEVADGEYAHVEGLEARYESLRELSKQLDDQDMGLEEAAIGCTVVEQVQSLDLNIKAVDEALGRITRLGDRLEDPDIDEAEYLQAALDLSETEQETGHSYRELQSRYEHLESQVESTNGDLERLEAERADLEETIESLQHKHDLATDIDSLEEEIDTARQRRAEAIAARDAAIEQTVETEAELELFRDVVAQAEAAGLDPEEGLEKLLTVLEGYSIEDIDQLQSIAAAVAEMDVDSDTVTEYLADCQAIAESGLDPAIAARIVETIVEYPGTFDAAVDQFQEDLSVHTSLASAVDDKQEEKKQLQSDCEHLEDEIATAEQQLEDLRETVETQQTAIQELSATREDIESTIDTCKTTATALQNTIEELRSEKQGVETELMDLKHERDALQAIRNYLETQQLSPGLIQELKNLQSPNHWSGLNGSPSPQFEKEAKQWLTAKLHELTEGEEAIAKSKHKVQVATLKADIQQLECERDTAQEEVDRLQDRVTTLEDDLDTAQEARETEESIRDLRRKLRGLEEERAAVAAIYTEFATYDQISESLVEDLYRIKKGKADHLKRYADRKERDVREGLIEVMTRLVEADQDYMSKQEHQERLGLEKAQLVNEYDERQEYLEEVIDQQAERIKTLHSEVLTRLTDSEAQ